MFAQVSVMSTKLKELKDISCCFVLHSELLKSSRNLLLLLLMYVFVFICWEISRNLLLLLLMYVFVFICWEI